MVPAPTPPSEETAPRADPAASPGERLALALCVAVGILLRGLEAAGKSLWLDELHTLDVASSASYAELNALLAADVHTPAFYLAVQALYGIVSPHALRLVAVVPGLLALVPLLALARSAGLSAAGRVVVVGLYATLPFQIQWGTELRPYAWLELCAVGAAWAAFTPAPASSRSSGRWMRALVFAGATALGLYTHLFAAIAVLGIGATRLVFRRREWLGLPALVGSGVLGVALFVPWFASTHPWFFEDFTVLWRDEKVAAVSAEELPPSATPAADRAQAPPEQREAAPPTGFSRQKLLQVPVQTLVPRMGSLGGAPAWMAKLSLGALALVGAGLLIASLRRPRPPSRELLAPLTAAVLSSVLLVLVCVKLVNRIPLQYFALSAWAWPLLFGALVDRLAPQAARARLAAWALLGAAALGGLGQALGASREDLAGAVEHALSEAETRDAWLTAVLWQPNSYAHTMPYWAYAPQAPYVEPEDVPAVDEPGGRRPVVVVTRSAPDTAPTNWTKWAPLQEGRRRLAVRHLDESISVYVYGPR